MSHGPSPRILYARARTPWQALVELARLMHSLRDDAAGPARALDGQVHVRLLDANEVDPNGGWLAEATWTPRG